MPFGGAAGADMPRMGSLFMLDDLLTTVVSPICVSPVVCHVLHPLRRNRPVSVARKREVVRIDFMR